jgi:uncharacterized protein (DUF697 family)
MKEQLAMAGKPVPFSDMGVAAIQQALFMKMDFFT